MNRRQATTLLILLLIALGACLLRLLIDRPPGGSLTLAWPDHEWAEFRITAILSAIIVGGSLALAGTLLQTMLRNPLASPFILGISSGAGLGIMTATWLAYVAGLSVASMPGQWGVPAAIGAFAALALVYGLGQRRGWLDPVALVLVGVVVSTICAGGMMFFQHLVPTGLRGQFTTWLMGTVPEVVATSMLGVTLGIAIVALLLCMYLAKHLDASLLSDDEARGVGVPLDQIRLLIFVICGVLTSIAVTLSGPIAFIGLIGPHAARLLLGGRHAMLLPGAVLCGIILLVGADVLRQLVDLGGGRMPVGVLLTLGGGVVFLCLLRVEMRRA